MGGATDRDAGELTILEMAESDLDAVMEIEFASFSSPWSRSFFRKIIQDPRCRAVVAREGDAVAGFAVFWFVGDFAEVGDIAVATSRRGRGIGRRLLDVAVSAARILGASTLLLEVRVSNEPALALYRRFGFREIHRRTGYYTRPVEDALVLALDLGAGAAEAPGRTPDDVP